MREIGTVRWFSKLRGYGFILAQDGTELFVHYSAIQMDGYRNLAEGDPVSFLRADSGKGPKAIQVQPERRG